MSQNRLIPSARLSCIATKTPHAELFSAFEYGETLTYKLYLPHEYLCGKAYVLLRRDEDGKEFRFEGELLPKSCRFVLDTASICEDGLERGLFYFVFSVGNKIFSQNEFGEGLFVSEDRDDVSSFQLSVYLPGTNRPTGYEGGILYQIFPDRFCRERETPFRKDAVPENWMNPVSEYAAYPGAPLKNNHFYGGNLYGVAAKLPELEKLGVTLLYLNPIFEAVSNHRYDTGRYDKVDETLGGEEALRFLLEEAKKRGIGVILDGVFNHTGSDSLYFNKYGSYSSLGAYQSKDSPYYDWYFFRDFPDSYESWWGIDILPKVNCLNESYRRYITGEDGVIERYTRLGVAGWRLDVADELPDEMLDAIAQAAKRANERAVIYGEVWEDASNKIAYSHRRRYFTGAQLQGVMNYPLKNALIAFLTTGDASFLFYTMRILYSHYPKAVSDMQMNVLSTHDTERILTVLGGAPDACKENSVLAVSKLSAQQRETAVCRLKAAVLLQMLLPGIPCIYYADEAGMEGYRDPFNRQPYPWGKEDQDVLSFYRAVTSFRRKTPLLKDAFYRGVSCEDGLFVFERFGGGMRLLVAVNGTEEPKAFPQGGVPVFSINAHTEQSASTLGAYGAVCFLLKDETE